MAAPSAPKMIVVSCKSAVDYSRLIIISPRNSLWAAARSVSFPNLFSSYLLPSIWPSHTNDIIFCSTGGGGRSPSTVAGSGGYNKLNLQTRINFTTRLSHFPKVWGKLLVKGNIVSPCLIFLVSGKTLNSCLSHIHHSFIQLSLVHEECDMLFLLLIVLPSISLVH